MSLRQEGRGPDVADLAELCPALDAAVRAGPPRLAPHLVGEELGQVRDVGGVLHQHLRVGAGYFTTALKDTSQNFTVRKIHV